MDQRLDLIFSWDAQFWYGFLPEPSPPLDKTFSFPQECSKVVNPGSIDSVEPDLINTVTSTFLNLDFTENGPIIPNLLVTSILVFLTFALWSALLFLRWQKNKLKEEVELQMEEFHLAQLPEENQIPPSPIDLIKKRDLEFNLTASDSPHRVRFSDPRDTDAKLRKRFKKFSYGPYSFENSNNMDTNFNKCADSHLEEPALGQFNTSNNGLSLIKRAMNFDEPDGTLDFIDDVDSLKPRKNGGRRYLQEAVPVLNPEYLYKYPHKLFQEAPSTEIYPILDREGDENLVQDIQEAINDTSGGLGDYGFNDKEGSPANLKDSFMSYFGLISIEKAKTFFGITTKEIPCTPKRIRYVKSWYTAQ